MPGLKQALTGAAEWTGVEERRMSESRHNFHPKDIHATAMSASLRAIAKTVYYYSSLIECVGGDDSAAGLLRSAAQSIEEAVERIAAQEFDSRARPGLSSTYISSESG